MMGPGLASENRVANIPGNPHSASADLVKPSAVATSSTALPAMKLLLAAHTSSATSTSSSVTGALMIASHVFCTCMRENPEYIASNDAAIIVLEHTVPAARHAMYEVPN